MADRIGAGAVTMRLHGRISLRRPLRELHGIVGALAALFAVIVAAPPAWAGYDHRSAELRDVLAKRQIDVTRDREILQQATDDWLKERNELFARLLDIAADASDSRDDRERAWVDAVKDARSRLARIFESAWGSLSKEPTNDTIQFHHVTLIEEDKFLAGLQETRVGEGADEIIRTRNRIDEMTGILDEKWRSISQQDDALDQQEHAVIAEIKDEINQEFKAALIGNRSVAEKIAAWANVGAKAGEAAGSNIADAIGKVLDALLSDNDRLKNRIFAFDDLIERENSGIYPLFIDSRHQTQEFVDKNNFVAAKARYDLVKTALDSYTSSLTTSAQKDDADELERDLLGKLVVHLTLTEHRFDAFVSKHRSRFFGPASDETLAKLTHRTEWENQWRIIDGMGLDAKLATWRRQTETWWGADLSKVSDEDKAKLREQIRSRIDELARALDEKQRTGKQVYDELRKAMEKGKAISRNDAGRHPRQAIAYQSDASRRSSRLRAASSCARSSSWSVRDKTTMSTRRAPFRTRRGMAQSARIRAVSSRIAPMHAAARASRRAHVRGRPSPSATARR